MAQAAPSPIELTTVVAVEPPLGRLARDLLRRAVPGHLVDDRFDGWPGTHGDPPLSTGPGFRAALALQDGALTGYLGGAVSRDRLQLDCLIDPSGTEPAGLGHQLVSALTPGLTPAPAHWLELWGRPSQPWHEQLAADHGLAPARTLYQMRCPLPVDLDGVPTRAFRPDDLDELRAVNNRSFAAHPDQSDQSVDDLLATMAQPWFRADGLRIHERDGRVAGFCWTKIHDHSDPARRLGEIYVIGVDPDFHGRGLGRPMTAAGLSWLADQGITTGMLYVEADNEPAVRTYLGLGFTVVRTDRAWSRVLDGRP